MIILQILAIYVWEIKPHLEEQINAPIALLVVQLAVETLQPVALAYQDMVLIMLQALVLNVLVIKLLQEERVPVYLAQLAAQPALIMLHAHPVNRIMDSATESVLSASTIRHQQVIQVSVQAAPMDVLHALIM